jgi:VWFA-related protein
VNALAGRHTCIAAIARFGILLASAGTFLVTPVRAQSPPSGSTPQSSSSASAAQSPAAPETPELNTHESSVPFQVRVNLVPIRVVIHDAKGHAVVGLRKDDFKVLEDGKPQVISTFSIETPDTLSQHAVRAEPGPGESGAAGPVESGAGFEVPARFVALVFDDVHLRQEDLVRSRMAANHYIDSSLQSTDRAAVFTISTQSQLDFTDDRAKLRETLLRVQPRPVAGVGDLRDPSARADCPSMDYYEADLIDNGNDQRAFNLATQDALACAFNGDRHFLAQAQTLATTTARQIDTAGDVQVEYALRRLREIVQRISTLPGQRSIVLVSPGFIYPTREYEVSEIIDRANRSNVFINTLDARGLYTSDPLGDISKPFKGSPDLVGQRAQYQLSGQESQSGVLLDLAYGTGGFAFYNNNDLDTGFHVVAAAPEVSYSLGFTPQNLKFDGRFHPLKVTLLTKGSFTIQARRGFFAPKHSVTAAEAAKQDIEEAVYSLEEEKGIPIALHTQFYKTDPSNAKITVLTHVDIVHMQFEKAGGRNENDLTVVAVLFDRDGNFVTGSEETVEMRLRDTTLEKLNHSGVTVRMSFDVKPGAYLVRLVVRDSKEAMLSAQNGVVEIPY